MDGLMVVCVVCGCACAGMCVQSLIGVDLVVVYGSCTVTVVVCSEVQGETVLPFIFP